MGRFLIGLLGVVLLGAGALYVFSEPDIPRSALEVKYGAGPKEFVDIQANNTTVPSRAHFRERGPKDAPVLLLLHGSNASFLTWEPWSKILSDKYHVIAL